MSEHLKVAKLAGVVRRGTDASGAIFSDDGIHRYSLWRQWDAAKPTVLFCLLNPSTADESKLDNTLTRCLRYADSWGCGKMVVVNAFALRSTDPENLKRVKDPVGPLNDEYIVREHAAANLTVVGWGTDGALFGRASRVLALLRASGRPVFTLKVTKEDHPSHPLYLKAALRPVPYVTTRW